ncbi:MAG: DUF4922 domain-containing protein [Ignavibacteriales bacterium]|nr:DUF4922 domain-containing protein [Ignavibacteriales bacterium]
MLKQKTFAVYDPHKNSLPELGSQLLDQQKQTWSQLADGYSSLDAAELRDVQCSGFSVRLQWNPARMVSAAAKVDDKSIRQRKCFLCVENLPHNQQGILYQEKFLILCNPAPIFPAHFTVSHVDHIPQALDSSVGDFLDLAQHLSPRFSIFYNGPQCGASAPDHLHFQSCPRNAIPVEVDCVDGRRRKVIKKSPSVALLKLKNYGRSVLVVESTDKDALSEFLGRFLAAWKRVQGTAEEPMVNVICTFRQMVWRVILFPRSKHRPDVYFKDGEERILISPAAVDMGGLVITPVEKDFRVVQAGIIENMFEEVSLTQETVDQIINRL